ncbi:MAG: DUF4124 domain-containing protein [Catenulispora sp.]|nr:DUF4124 domain-containing protein [Catenulispora sp.]
MIHRNGRALTWGTLVVVLGLGSAGFAPAAAAGSSAPAGETAAHHWAPKPSNGFSPRGPWNTKLPANVPQAPNSQAIVANILQDKTDNYGSWAINTVEYSAPIFTADRSTPRTAWTYSNCLNMPELAPVIADSLKAVPTPPDLIASQGTDEAVAIYEPDTDTYWDFWRAEKDASGHWSACWGGEIKHYKHNPGIFPNPLGATATGLPMGAFLIRPEELAAGHIDHAVNISVVRTQANCFSWPATRDDGNTPGADIPCEGQRFRLDPTFDVNTLQSPAARTIARAMQEYGLILTDKAGAVVTQAEDPRPIAAANGGVDPYDLLFDPSGTYPESMSRYVLLNDIPIDRLQALPLNYGEPAR